MANRRRIENATNFVSAGNISGTFISIGGVSVGPARYKDRDSSDAISEPPEPVRVLGTDSNNPAEIIVKNSSSFVVTGDISGSSFSIGGPVRQQERYEVSSKPEPEKETKQKDVIPQTKVSVEGVSEFVLAEAIRDSTFSIGAIDEGGEETTKSALIGEALPSSSKTEYYKLDSKPRGKCVIINNENFGVKGKRQGTDKDAERIEKIFRDKLHFKVLFHKDLKGDEMVNKLKETASKINSFDDCFVCFVLSHGEEGKVLGVDSQTVDISELTKPFKPCHCKPLARKPKLFFFQACQGKVIQAATEVDGNPNFIPNEADFLLAYATVPGYQALRNTEHGSWYIQALADMLEEHADSEDLQSILVRVNGIVNKRIEYEKGTTYVQSPIYSDALTKKVSFVE